MLSLVQSACIVTTRGRRYSAMTLSLRVDVSPPPFPPLQLSTTAAPMPYGVKSAQSTSKEAQSTSQEARYQQRKSLVQRELSNATRLFARQLTD